MQVGAPTSSLGKLGLATELDGVDDYIDFGTDSSLDIFGPNQDFSICSWAKNSDIGSASSIFAWGTNSSSGGLFRTNGLNRVNFTSPSATASLTAVSYTHLTLPTKRIV